MLDRRAYDEADEEREDEEEEGLDERADAYDPLAEFNQMESQAKLDFETWEQKKVRIFAMFRQYTEGAAIEIGDGKQKPKQAVD